MITFDYAALTLSHSLSLTLSLFSRSLASLSQLIYQIKNIYSCIYFSQNEQEMSNIRYSNTEAVLNIGLGVLTPQPKCTMTSTINYGFLCPLMC